MAGTNPNNFTLTPNGFDSEFFIRRIAATSSTPSSARPWEYSEQVHQIRDGSPVQQGDDTASGSEYPSNNAGESTSNFSPSPSNNRTVMLAGKRHHENQGNEDEKSNSEEARSFDKRRKANMSSSDHGMDDASPNPHTLPGNMSQDPSVKCQACLKQRRACDQAKPKCSACVKRASACVPQHDQRPTAHQDPSFSCNRCVRDRLVCDQDRPRCGNCQEREHACEYQNGNSTILRKNRPNVQDFADKCHHCFTRGYWCDGNSPCGACVKSKVRLCCPQGSKQKNMHGIPKGDRCWPCRRDRLMCNGEERCDTCIKKNRSCDKDRVRKKCMHCFSKSMDCDGAAPCGTCMRDKVTVCRYLDDDGIIEWHYDTTSEPKDVYGDCLGCVRYEGVLVGPPVTPCDRQRPCNNCLTIAKRKNCRYQVDGCLQMVIPKGEKTSTGHEREATKTKSAGPGEETYTDDSALEDSAGDKSDFDDDDDVLKDDQNSAGPSNTRQQEQGWQRDFFYA